MSLFLFARSLQADDMSSSDDDQLSDSAGGFDLSLSARKPASTPTRGEQGRASEEDFNVLDSFDLPEEALQDKVGFQVDCRCFRVFAAIASETSKALGLVQYLVFQTVFCFHLSAWDTTVVPGDRKLLVRPGECTWTPLCHFEVRTIFWLAQHEGEQVDRVFT